MPTLVEKQTTYRCRLGECYRLRWCVCCQECEQRPRCDLVCKRVDDDKCEGKEEE